MPPPRDLIADSKRYHDDTAPHLRHLGCIPRLPHPLGSGAEVSTHALALDGGPRLDDPPRDQRLERCHDGLAQRWLVVSSQAADARAAATRNHARHRASEASHTPRLPRHAHRVATPEAAHEALTAGGKGWTSHQVDSCHLSDHHRAARQGRPTPRRPVQAIAWPIQAHVRPADAALESQTHRQAGCVLGPPIGTSAWQATAVITADPRPSQGEGGCRGLHEPRLLVSSWLVKQPCRLQGLLMVMTRAFLIDAVAQRRLRQPWAPHQETVPHHINPPTTTPT